jgi:hypothetical protein
MTSSHNQSRFLSAEERQQFEAAEPPELKHADIWMISGCEDRQTSADVSNVHSFQLPDPAGRAGGACTATLLSVLYENEKNPCKEYTFADVIERMRQQLQKKGFHQVPQLTSTRPISLGDTPFKIVPDAYQEFPGATKRAVLIGINYRGHKKGELRGCHNDAFNMVRDDAESIEIDDPVFNISTFLMDTTTQKHEFCVCLCFLVLIGSTITSKIFMAFKIKM